MITKVIELPKGSNKRFMAELSLNGIPKRIKFGAPGGSTFLDHGDKKKRENYWKRHMANPVEKYRIENFIPSAALLSAFLLWGESTDMRENVEALNGLF
jgi:hypothetical protein